MRLDVFLKISRIISRRSLAQEFCDAGLVSLNGSAARSSKEVRVGDEIAIKRRDRISRFLVIAVPDKKQISKEESATLFRVIAEEAIGEI
ncbi:MAG: RNA-binding S4 domain-containing protein [Pyrinomonadaceae bacterium]|nr:RNA-binding S4 domain-containing protein [Pyrinomonadaceae bacterium]